MKYLSPLALSISLALAGCSSTSSSSEEATNALIADIQAPRDASDLVQWVQPQNQSVDCKIYSSMSRTAPSAIHQAYWDGKCKGGYASGIGLEAMTSEQGSGSAIANYSAGQTKPDYYYQNNDEPGLVAFGDPENGNLMLLAKGSTSGSPVFSLVTMTRESDGTVYSSLFNPETGDTSFVKQFPSGYELVYRYPASPKDPVAIEAFTLKNNAVVGYAIRQHKDASVDQLKMSAGSARAGRVPEPYIQFLQSTLTQVRQKSAAALHNAESSVATSIAYRSAQCGQQARQHVATPTDLCTERADLSRYAGALKAIDAKREQRFTNELNARNVARRWLQALADYNATNQRPSSSLDDAVAQYVESVKRARTMVDYIERSAAAGL
ncbi:hypothetical protein [Pseudomonas aegrilactucae]|uniref:Lipoprotein n=1 Tax=Pseudomonas aegrilactucae TaxID=2854028 RepID=A0A9Q2XLA0_9PSED|nr:hypothetical protein [Pseudomonas aegrilactucae]MBV6288763.1 hypothetical protein [Pseudomonas aegrilactucae]